MATVEIQQLHEFDGEGFGGSSLGFYAKGQHEPAVFIKALEDEYDYTCHPSHIKSGHFRKVPCEGGHMWISGKPGRGAFVATYVDDDATRFITDECLLCGKPHSELEPCGEPAPAVKEG